MDIPTFVKNEQGLYHVQGCVKPEEIVSTAATILLDELTGRDTLTAPTDVAQFLQMALAQEKNEVFAAIFLNNKHKVLSFEPLFNGTIDGAAVYPRVVVQQALACNAAAELCRSLASRSSTSFIKLIFLVMDSNQYPASTPKVSALTTPISKATSRMRCTSATTGADIFCS